MEQTKLQSNIFDCALIFEGGGMRASYTAAVVNALLAEGIYFDHVYGVSAGSSNTVNYLSRDRMRTWESFTALAADPHFGDWRTWLSGKGIFNAQWIYQEAGLPDGIIPFDFETFAANPAKLTIAGFERDTGRSCMWGRDDMQTLEDVMLHVRASSTLPVLMPAVKIDGQVCYDGGLAEGNGLLIPAAVADGFSKFFIVRTRPKGFRKPEHPGPIVNFFWRYPHMQQALLEWGPGYNAMCDLAEQLEAEGRALVVYAEDQMCENNTTDVELLLRNYELGEAQAQRDLPKWKEFLGI
ncbi:MAG: patatin family protein [Eggerthellaceae bacterium]|nr:patatin family protein [Eggerthellaceae bacterium]